MLVIINCIRFNIIHRHNINGTLYHYYYVPSCSANILITHIKYAKLLSVCKTSVKTRVTILLYGHGHTPPPPPPHNMYNVILSTGITFCSLIFGEEFLLRSGGDIETPGVGRPSYYCY